MTVFEMQPILALTRYACEAYETAGQCEIAARKIPEHAAYFLQVAQDYRRMAVRYEAQIQERLAGLAR